MSKARTVEYSAWCSMKARCGTQSHKSYANYGGRGISVCPEWLTSFDKFLQDMGLRPSKLYSLERLDNDKGYFPSNCRWATRADQNTNKRNNFIVEFRGESKTFKDWCATIDFKTELGLTNHAVYCRITAYGWSVEKAFTQRAKETTLVGNLTVDETAAEIGCSAATVRLRLSQGLTGDSLTSQVKVGETYCVEGYDSKSRTILQWSKLYKASEPTTRKWVLKGKLPGVKSTRAPIEFKGQSMTSINWASLWGIDRKMMSYYRVRRGLSMQEIYDNYGPGSK